MPTKEQTNLKDVKVIHRALHDPSTWKFFYEAKKGVTYEYLKNQVNIRAEQRALGNLIEADLLTVKDGIVEITSKGWRAVREIEDNGDEIKYSTKRRRTEERFMLGNKWEDDGRQTPMIHPT